MKSLYKNFKAAFLLVLKHWPILLITVALSLHVVFFYTLHLPQSFFPFYSFIFMLIELGWLGTQLKFLQIAYQKDAVPWKILPQTFTYSLKKLFPAAFLLTFVLSIFSLVFIFMYFAWASTQSGLTIRPADHTNNVKLFFDKTGISSHLVLFIFTLMRMITAVTLVIFTVEHVGISDAIGKSFLFLKDNRTFTVAYFLLLTGIALLSSITTSLVLTSTSNTLSLYNLPMHLMNIPYTSLYLIIDATIIIYYLRNRKTVVR